MKLFLAALCTALATATGDLHARRGAAAVAETLPATTNTTVSLSEVCEQSGCFVNGNNQFFTPKDAATGLACASASVDGRGQCGMSQGPAQGSGLPCGVAEERPCTQYTANKFIDPLRCGPGMFGEGLPRELTPKCPCAGWAGLKGDQFAFCDSPFDDPEGPRRCFVDEGHMWGGDWGNCVNSATNKIFEAPGKELRTASAANTTAPPLFQCVDSLSQRDDLDIAPSPRSRWANKFIVNGVPKMTTADLLATPGAQFKEEYLSTTCRFCPDGKVTAAFDTRTAEQCTDCSVGTHAGCPAGRINFRLTITDLYGVEVSPATEKVDLSFKSVTVVLGDTQKSTVGKSNIDQAQHERTVTAGADGTYPPIDFGCVPRSAFVENIHIELPYYGAGLDAGGAAQQCSAEGSGNFYFIHKNGVPSVHPIPVLWFAEMPQTQYQKAFPVLMDPVMTFKSLRGRHFASRQDRAIREVDADQQCRMNVQRSWFNAQKNVAVNKHASDAGVVSHGWSPMMYEDNGKCGCRAGCTSCPEHPQLTDERLRRHIVVGFQGAIGFPTCVHCLPGKFQDDTASAQCKQCAKGHYTERRGATACTACPGGKFAPVAGLISCVACDTYCPAGKAVQDCGGPSAGSGCTACAAGQFKAEGSGTCVPCAPGTYGNTMQPQGSGYCHVCPPGRAQPSEGVFASSSDGGCVACDAPGPVPTQSGAAHCAHIFGANRAIFSQDDPAGATALLIGWNAMTLLNRLRRRGCVGRSDVGERAAQAFRTFEIWQMTQAAVLVDTITGICSSKIQYRLKFQLSVYSPIYAVVTQHAGRTVNTTFHINDGDDESFLRPGSLTAGLTQVMLDVCDFDNKANNVTWEPESYLYRHMDSTLFQCKRAGTCDDAAKRGLASDSQAAATCLGGNLVEGGGYSSAAGDALTASQADDNEAGAYLFGEDGILPSSFEPFGKITVGTYASGASFAAGGGVAYQASAASHGAAAKPKRPASCKDSVQDKLRLFKDDGGAVPGLAGLNKTIQTMYVKNGNEQTEICQKLAIGEPIGQNISAAVYGKPIAGVDNTVQVGYGLIEGIHNHLQKDSAEAVIVNDTDGTRRRLGLERASAWGYSARRRLAAREESATDYTRRMMNLTRTEFQAFSNVTERCFTLNKPRSFEFGGRYNAKRYPRRMSMKEVAALSQHGISFEVRVNDLAIKSIMEHGAPKPVARVSSFHACLERCIELGSSCHTFTHIADDPGFGARAGGCWVVAANMSHHRRAETVAGVTSGFKSMLGTMSRDSLQARAQLSVQRAAFANWSSAVGRGVMSSTQQRQADHWQDPSSPLPESFDPREEYPMCHTFKYIGSQRSSCSGCWAWAMAQTMSGRQCVQSEGKFTDMISPDSYLTNTGSICGQGGTPFTPYAIQQFRQDEGNNDLADGLVLTQRKKLVMTRPTDTVSYQCLNSSFDPQVNPRRAGSGPESQFSSFIQDHPYEEYPGWWPGTPWSNHLRDSPLCKRRYKLLQNSLTMLRFPFKYDMQVEGSWTGEEMEKYTKRLPENVPLKVVDLGDQYFKTISANAMLIGSAEKRYTYWAWRKEQCATAASEGQCGALYLSTQIRSAASNFKIARNNAFMAKASIPSACVGQVGSCGSHQTRRACEGVLNADGTKQCNWEGGESAKAYTGKWGQSMMPLVWIRDCQRGVYMPPNFQGSGSADEPFASRGLAVSELLETRLAHMRGTSPAPGIAAAEKAGKICAPMSCKVRAGYDDSGLSSTCTSRTTKDACLAEQASLSEPECTHQGYVWDSSDQRCVAECTWLVDFAKGDTDTACRKYDRSPTLCGQQDSRCEHGNPYSEVTANQIVDILEKPTLVLDTRGDVQHVCQSRSESKCTGHQRQEACNSDTDCWWANTQCSAKDQMCNTAAPSSNNCAGRDDAVLLGDDKVVADDDVLSQTCRKRNGCKTISVWHSHECFEWHDDLPSGHVNCTFLSQAKFLNRCRPADEQCRPRCSAHVSDSSCSADTECVWAPQKTSPIFHPVMDWLVMDWRMLSFDERGDTCREFFTQYSKQITGSDDIGSSLQMFSSTSKDYQQPDLRQTSYEGANAAYNCREEYCGPETELMRNVMDATVQTSGAFSSAEKARWASYVNEDTMPMFGCLAADLANATARAMCAQLTHASCLRNSKVARKNEHNNCQIVPHDAACVTPCAWDETAGTCGAEQQWQDGDLDCHWAGAAFGGDPRARSMRQMNKEKILDQKMREMQTTLAVNEERIMREVRRGGVTVALLSKTMEFSITEDNIVECDCFFYWDEPSNAPVFTCNVCPFDSKQCKPTQGYIHGDHAVVLIGWGEENGIPYWLGKNSWGSEWGDEGLFRVRRGINSCLTELAHPVISDPDLKALELDTQQLDHDIRMNHTDTDRCKQSEHKDKWYCTAVKSMGYDNWQCKNGGFYNPTLIVTKDVCQAKSAAATPAEREMCATRHTRDVCEDTACTWTVPEPEFPCSCLYPYANAESMRNERTGCTLCAPRCSNGGVPTTGGKCGCVCPFGFGGPNCEDFIRAECASNETFPVVQYHFNGPTTPGDFFEVETVDDEAKMACKKTFPLCTSKTCVCAPGKPGCIKADNDCICPQSSGALVVEDVADDGDIIITFTRFVKGYTHTMPDKFVQLHGGVAKNTLMANGSVASGNSFRARASGCRLPKRKHCEAGKYRLPGGLACKKCPAGRYTPVDNMKECAACADNYNTPEAGGASSCQACPVGRLTVVQKERTTPEDTCRCMIPTGQGTAGNACLQGIAYLIGMNQHMDKKKTGSCSSYFARAVSRIVQASPCTMDTNGEPLKAAWAYGSSKSSAALWGDDPQYTWKSPIMRCCHAEVREMYEKVRKNTVWDHMCNIEALSTTGCGLNDKCINAIVTHAHLSRKRQPDYEHNEQENDNSFMAVLDRGGEQYDSCPAFWNDAIVDVSGQPTRQWEYDENSGEYAYTSYHVCPSAPAPIWRSDAYRRCWNAIRTAPAVYRHIIYAPHVCDPTNQCHEHVPGHTNWIRSPPSTKGSCLDIDMNDNVDAFDIIAIHIALVMGREFGSEAMIRDMMSRRVATSSAPGANAEQVVANIDYCLTAGRSYAVSKIANPAAAGDTSQITLLDAKLLLVAATSEGTVQERLISRVCGESCACAHVEDITCEIHSAVQQRIQLLRGEPLSLA